MVNHTTDSIIHCVGNHLTQEDNGLIKLEQGGVLDYSDSICIVEIYHTTDSELAPTGERRHITDSTIKKLDNTIAHTTNTILTCQGNNITQEDDSLILLEDGSSLIYQDKLCTITLTHTTNSDLTNHQKKIHTTDSVIGERDPGLNVNHTTSSVFTCQANYLTQEDGDLIELEQGGLLVYSDHTCTVSLEYTTDSDIQNHNQRFHTTDSIIGERDPGFTVSHTTDSIVHCAANQLTQEDGDLIELEDGSGSLVYSDSVCTVEINHTTDSHIFKKYNVSHTTDSVLGERIPGFTLYHTTDSFLTGTYTVSHTTDAQLTSSKTIDHDTDSILRNIDNELSHTTDSYLLKSVTIFNTTDSVTKKLDLTSNHTTDSVTRKIDTEISHTTDSVLGERDPGFTVKHTTDSVLGERDPGLTVSHDTDSVLKGLGLSSTHTTDSTLGERDPGFTVSHTTDSHLVDTVTKILTHTTDSIIHCGANQLTQEDGDLIILEDGSGSLVYSDSVCTVEINHNTDSHIVSGVDLTFDTDSTLKKLGLSVSHTTDSVLGEREPGFTVNHTTDSVLGERDPGFTVSHDTDSVTKKLDITTAHTTDSILGEREPGFTVSHTTDSHLVDTVVRSVTHDTDSVTKKLDTEVTHDTDSTLKKLGLSVNHTTDSILGEREPGFTVSHTTDSVTKKLDTDITHNTDSVTKKLDTEVTHDTDSILKKLDITLTHTTDSHLVDTVVRSVTHTTDSYLVKIIILGDILVFIPSNESVYSSIPSNASETININGIEEITVIG